MDKADKLIGLKYGPQASVFRVRDEVEDRVVRFTTKDNGVIYGIIYYALRGDDIADDMEDGYAVCTQKGSGSLSFLKQSQIAEIEVVGDWPDKEETK